MADLESPEIEDAVTPEENQADFAPDSAFLSKEPLPKTSDPTYLLNRLGKYTSRLDSMHRIMFDVGNYFFTFQGVCLAAISNSSFFDCDNAWFLTMLCLLAAIPSLVALTFVALKWLWILNQIDDIMAKLEAIEDQLEDYTDQLAASKNGFSILIGRRYSTVARYFLLVVGAVIYLTFTVAVAAGPYTIICGHVHPWRKGGGRVYSAPC